MKLLRSAMCAAALALSAAPAAAATIFDTGTPTGQSGYSLLYLNPDLYQGLAARFTLVAPIRVTGIEAYLGLSVAGNDQLDMTLYAAGTSVPNRPFDVEIAKRQIVVPSSGEPNWLGSFYDGPVLSAGNYWLTLTSDPANPTRCFCYLQAGAPRDISFGAYNNNFTGTNWLERDLFFGFRVFGDAAAAVPEPGSWALMIGGFGIVGGLSRRRRGMVSA